VIPSNDDAIRAVKLIVGVIADAVEEGRRVREVDLADSGQVSQADLADMEQYLGPSTLAKLQVDESEAPEAEVVETEATEVVAEAEADAVEAIAETEAKGAEAVAEIEAEGAEVVAETEAEGAEAVVETVTDEPADAGVE